MPRANHKLKERRLSLGLKQSELAARAKVSLRTVGLVENGKNVKPATLEAIANSLRLTVDEIVDEAEDDAFAEPGSILRYVAKFVQPEPMTFCASQFEAGEAIEMMQKYWQEHLARCESYPDADAYRIGCKTLIDKGFEIYRRRYLSIWNRNRSTLCFASRNRERIGVSVIIPVSDEAYENVLTGSWSFMDVTSEHVCDRSQNLIIDSGVEFADRKNGNRRKWSWYNLTDSLRFAVFYQLAVLSHDAAASDFRVISFGASPLNAERLEHNGFSNCNVDMPEFGFPVYEFSNCHDEDSREAHVRRTIASHCVQLFKQLMPSDLGGRAKRQLVRRALRAYQLLLLRSINRAA